MPICCHIPRGSVLDQVMCLVSKLFRLLHIPPEHWVQIPDKLVHKDRRPSPFCDRIDRHRVGCSEIDSSQELHVKKIITTIMKVNLYNIQLYHLITLLEKRREKVHTIYLYQLNSTLIFVFQHCI